ncbi:MAG: DEAD/DEAH box helicase [Verrucomicrobiota bacterium]
MSEFERLGVSKKLVQRLGELEIETPTEVQEQAIPFLLEDGSDFVCQAQTGTGKTAAFGLPLLMKVNPEDGRPQALILAPTRELVQQIAKQIFRFTKHFGRVFAEPIFGGGPIDEQKTALKRKTHIIVATPGRLMDLIEADAIDLSQVKHVVLDEADEMLSMGWKEALNSIIIHLRNRDAMWLFSATIPKGIQDIITNYMSHNCRQVRIDKENVVNRAISHQCILCDIEDKVHKIVEFLDGQDEAQGLVFCRTKAGAINLAKDLDGEGFDAADLQGDLSQKDREKVMRSFKKKRIQVLVATDVAARGIDVQDLGFVIHHQLPEQTEQYIHRSGRTARAGKSGVSLALIAGRDRKRMRELEKELGISFDLIG